MSTHVRPLYKTVLFKITATLLTLYCLIWVLSSPIIKYIAKEPLADIGLVLADESQITYNPFLTRVTISDLSLLKEDQTVFSSKHLILQLALHKLLIDKVVIEKFSIDGITIEIEKEAEKLIVAGIQITPTTVNAKNESEQKNDPIEAPKEPLPYQVLLNALVLTNTNINVLLEKQSHQLTINKLVISDLQATETQQLAHIKLQSLIDGASLNITANLQLENGEGLIESDTQISEYSLINIQHLIKPLSQLSGSLSFSSKQTLKIANNVLNVEVENAELLNTQLLVSTVQNTVNLDKLAFSINDLKLSLINNKLADVTGLAQMSLTKLDVSGENEQQQIISFSQLNIDNIKPSFPKNSNNTLQDELLPTATIELLTIDDLLFSQNKTNDLPAIATIKKISVLNIIAASDSIGIDTIDIDSITSHIILNKEKALANLVALSSEKNTETEKNTTETSSEPTAATSSKPFQITLNAFNVINNNQIDFLDNSVEPVYKRSIMIDELFVGTISNQSSLKENKTPIKLVGRSNEYANFTFGGFITPFAQQKTYRVKGHFKELSLPAVSTYMKDALELELTSGQLNTEVDVTLVDDVIDGEISFNIKGLETGAADSYETNTVKDQVGIPLNAALGMLKDSNGNLELDIPLAGKTSDPSFGISSFIALITKKAVMSATESYIMKTFVPYANIVSVAMTAGDFILKVRFEDLPYQPTQLKLDEKQSEYITQFIALMKDKEDTQVKICAVSTPADIGLQADVKLSEKNIKKLKEIGNEREKNFKSKVVKEGIKSDRILLCTPQIDNAKDSLPRMTISV